jgi:hypothetical protein
MTFNDVGLSDDGFEFNGSSSYIKSPIDNKYNFEEYTVELIFTPSEIMGSVFYGLVSLRSHWGTDNTVFEVAQIEEDIRCYIYADNFKNVRYNINVGTKYHVVFSCNGTDIKLYFNGELVDQGTGVSYIPNVKTDLYIGRRADAAIYGKGIIKHVSIYNRALTAQEVADRYNEVTFQFLNDTPTPTQQNYIDFWDNRKIGRQ